MANRVTISGIEECSQFFDNAPEKLLKVVKECVRKGGQACAKHVKSGVSSRWKSMVKSKASKGGDGNYYATFGMFNGHQRDGKQPRSGDVDTWSKAYWLNYGTLEGRDPGHTFKKAVKSQSSSAAKRRRNRTGEKHTNFFENALSGYESVYVDKFNETLKKRIEEVY